jgi:DNA-binding PucR family transcriptional regulator
MTGDLLHPALGILSRYDAIHKSDLFHTLYIFLSNERNVVATAKCLFIHRNSLLYRLQRIERLISADLEDVNVRMYLLLSYHIEMQKQPKRSALEENIKEHTDDR